MRVIYRQAMKTFCSFQCSASLQRLRILISRKTYRCHCRLADWIGQGGAADQAAAADSLRSDAEKFPAVVADEISQLVGGVSKDRNLGFFVFTIALTHEGKFQTVGVDDSGPSFKKLDPG